MLLVGAGNIGLQILEIIHTKGLQDEIVFFDNNSERRNHFLNPYFITNDIDIAKKSILEKDKRFFVCIGNSRIRSKYMQLFESFGAEASSFVCNSAKISPFVTNLELSGSLIHFNVLISHSVKIGKSCLIYANALVSHQTEIGDYVNIGPGASLHSCKIGDFSFIGAGAIILPGITIGKNVRIGAGAIVKKDIKDYETFNGEN